MPCFSFDVADLGEDRVLVHVRARLETDSHSLSAAEDRILAFVFTEMVNNAIEHAHAERVSVSLEIRKDAVALAVVDDGIGQGFADEVFRVWALQHPTIRLVPTNMVDEVRFFVERAERAR